MMELLQVNQVHKHFGGIPALQGVSLQVEKGKIHGVIGPNGAGKTTMFNVINGIYSPDEGKVVFKDREITGLKPNQIASLGIGRTFQVARIFNEMTLMENLLVPLIPRRVSKKEGEKKALELLEMAGLTHLRDQLGVEISGGQKKLLEFMRTMMADPEVILLDEPFAGVNPALIERLIEVTLELNRTRGKTFLLISHDIPSVMKLCKNLTVLSAGTTIAEGESEEIRHDPAVIDAYLGH
ncbi:MAG: ABC transporter ATP-binding protein [Deltaproteobacteria bacterium]|nr:ABC transporter ATP-binding protein [Deltaproteobacteria bacterium]